MKITIRFGEQLEEIFKKTQAIVCLSSLMFSTAVSASFGDDCKNVGNYIYDNAAQVHDSLYVKYNGVGERKKETFENRYKSLAWRANYDVGYYIEDRDQYYKDNFNESYKYLVENQFNERKIFDQKLKDSFKLNFKTEERIFSLFYARSFCRKLTHKQAKKCRRNIRDIFKLTQIQQIWPYQNGPTTSLTLPHIVKNVLTSPEHLKLSYLALTPLMRKALTKDYQSNGNIKLLLHEKVKMLDYLTSKQQNDLVWDTLAYYATRGASPEGYAENLTTPQTLYSFSSHYELINLTHVFDSEKTSGENLFSMPEIKKNSCIVGKPYHFWMSAYLARHLVKNGVDKKQAFFAAAVTGVLYDFMGSGAPQRERIRIYQEPLNSVFTMSIQQSLLYKAVGAYYGVNDPNKLELNMDKLYQIIKDNQIKTDRRIYKKTITHFKNLKNFLDHTAIDLIIMNLADKM